MGEGAVFLHSTKYYFKKFYCYTTHIKDAYLKCPYDEFLHINTPMEPPPRSR